MAEEKRFAVVDQLSIQRVAESCGIDILQEDAATALAEDATYRIRELVSISAQFMRRARRRCMKCKDVAKALNITGVPMNPAHQLADNTEFEYVEDGGFYIEKDDLINLHDVALLDGPENEMLPPNLHSNWHLSTDPSKPKDCDDIPVLMEYFSNVVSCILGDNQTLRRESLLDLQRNSKISPLIPHFVTFSLNVKAVSHDLEQLFHLLQTVSALTMNPFLNFLGYLKPLASSVLYCVLEPLTASINPINDHWRLRDFGGRILACMVARHGLRNSELTKYIRGSVKNILADPTRPLCSHYGAIATVNSLGISAIREILCPGLLSYYQTCLKIIEEDTDANNLQLKEDAFKVLGVVLQSLENLCRSISKGPEMHNKALYKFCTEMLSLFGDSLQARLPITSLKDTKIGLASRSGVSAVVANFNGPGLARSKPVLHRPRPNRRIDVFGPNHLRNRGMSILHGRINPSAERSSNFQQSQYFSLATKTAYVGKLKCLSRNFHTNEFSDLSELTL